MFDLGDSWCCFPFIPSLYGPCLFQMAKIPSTKLPPSQSVEYIWMENHQGIQDEDMLAMAKGKLSTFNALRDGRLIIKGHAESRREDCEDWDWVKIQ